MTSGLTLICEIILSILLSPLSVCLRYRCCTVDVLICLVLTILGYLSGISYALYTILCVNPDSGSDRYEVLTDMGARAFYEPRLVSDFVAEFLGKDITRPLSDQE